MPETFTPWTDAHGRTDYSTAIPDDFPPVEASGGVIPGDQWLPDDYPKRIRAVDAELTPLTPETLQRIIDKLEEL